LDECGPISPKPQRPATAEVVLELLPEIRRRYQAETTVYIVMDILRAAPPAPAAHRARGHRFGHDLPS
jgi:hypothetical protein